MKRIAFISLAFLFLTFLAADSSFACSCAQSVGPLKAQVKTAFGNATVIFAGEVLSITPQSVQSVAVNFNVEKSWKGILTREITVKTPANSAMCGYTFEVGKSYLVYAFGANDSPSTTNCSRTRPSINNADIKYLNKLKRQKVKTS